jgi:5'-methylthioadenosine phosphorylase
MPRIGIIGGSGLYDLPGLRGVGEVAVETPYGSPSDAFLVGTLDGVELAFLSRHGRGHRFPPHQVPYRANLWAMRKLGVEWVISVSAVGSLSEGIAPGDVVLCDQFIDRTRSRPSTFFEDGVVAHVGFGDPVCATLRGMLLEASRDAGAVTHDGGAYVCIEGPTFSTRAESELFRSWGAAVVGMTNLPEARLAREAELSYATVALVTDYDCWHTDHDHVSVETVLAVLRANVALARRIVAGAVPRIAAWDGPAPMSRALENAVMTASSAITPEARARVGLFLERYGL